MTYQYLLFFDKDQVMVIEHEERNGKKLHYITNQGEKQFPLNSDFWTWWKAAVSYIDGEFVDFCFLYDKEYSMVKHSLPAVQKSCWDRELVEVFFSEMTEYSHISIMAEDGTEMLIDKKNVLFSDNTPSVFYTNIPLKGDKKVKEIADEKEINPFARYCRELLEETNR